MCATESNHPPNRRCNLLHMVSTFAIKTDTKWLLQIARHLDRERFNLSAACFYDGGPIRDELESLGVRTFDLDLPHEFDPRAVLRAKRLIYDLHCDIVHTHLLRADLFGAAAARFVRVPVVLSTAYAIGAYRRAKRRRADPLLDLACSKLPTHTIAVSEAVKRDCVERLGIAPEHVTVIHTGIDPPQHVDMEQAAALRRQWGVSDETPLIVTLSRLSYEKGIDTLIDAAALLKKTHPQARIVVVGDGPDEAALRERIQEKRVEDTVRLAGFHDDVWPALAAADYVCMPSKSEGMPNVLLEAMAMRKPIVATTVGGIPEAITSEENGLLIPPEQPQTLADALARVIADASFAQRIADAGSRTMQERFHVRDVVARYAETYQRLLSEWRPQHAGVGIAN